MQKVNLEEKFRLFDQYFTPKIVGELNGQYIKIAKFLGEFSWHTHEGEDEFFQVIKGSIIIHLRNESITLNEGECFIVPRGVEHKPQALEEAHIMMFEPKSTGHTGTLENEQTIAIENQQWL
ncbi:cupin domain-containing protein [Agarilytica rhodophyticola]|uniref:cupin domain-containing protein n=1 Tax=Agarilytica rhodophyticola TaxID=1737490 RepID=UPI000B3466EE|nr:cupin domain-containing protein [Agarilytica rhodophyticola]